jgi:4'-phosphopantetheinyl transferase
MQTTIERNPVTTLEHELRIKFISTEEVPAPGTFLSSRELEKHASFKIEKRRREWRGGRYAAKTLIKESLALEMPLSAIEISYDPFGRPVWAGGGIQLPLSITHSHSYCAAACASENAAFLGIDLEIVEPRANAWYKDYFHKSELQCAAPAISHMPYAVGQTPTANHKETPNNAYGLKPKAYGNLSRELVLAEIVATRLWTQKEALLKALGLGLKADPLDINLAGETTEFSRTALTRYLELGSPAFTLTTLSPEPDYYLSAVCAKGA